MRQAGDPCMPAGTAHPPEHTTGSEVVCDSDCPDAVLGPALEGDCQIATGCLVAFEFQINKE